MIMPREMIVDGDLVDYEETTIANIESHLQFGS